jgi:nucleoside-diphosphate-sugar epimerase
MLKHVLVTGGAGYVGAVLVPKLLSAGYEVTVLDWYLYYPNIFRSLAKNPSLHEVKGDIRNTRLIKKLLKNTDAILHLACIASDQSFDLSPKISKEINYDATCQLFDEAVKSGVKRFVYASSSAVYGNKGNREVTENLSLEPLTAYARYKAMSEKYLTEHFDELDTIIVRPAAICGFSPRLRLDLSLNTLTIQALVNKKINVFGGKQKRAQIYIEDIARFYIQSLRWPKKKVAGQVFNFNVGNYSLKELATIVTETLDDPAIRVVFSPSRDDRSYTISSAKIHRTLGFRARFTVQNAVQSIKDAYIKGKIPHALTDSRYYNMIRMKEKTYVWNKEVR